MDSLATVEAAMLVTNGFRIEDDVLELNGGGGISARIDGIRDFSRRRNHTHHILIASPSPRFKFYKLPLPLLRLRH